MAKYIVYDKAVSSGLFEAFEVLHQTIWSSIETSVGTLSGLSLVAEDLTNDTAMYYQAKSGTYFYIGILR